MDGMTSLAATMAQAQTQAVAGRQQAMTAGMGSASQTKMKEKAQEFESFFLYQTLELMSPENKSEFNGGVGEEMFKHQMNEEMAKSMVRNGGVGLSSAVYNELARMQHEQQSGGMATASPTAPATPVNP